MDIGFTWSFHNDMEIPLQKEYSSEHHPDYDALIHNMNYFLPKGSYIPVDESNHGTLEMEFGEDNKEGELDLEYMLYNEHDYYLGILDDHKDYVTNSHYSIKNDYNHFRV